MASPEFSGSSRFRAFLRFIVAEALAGRGDNLKAYTVAVEVFGRDAGFDPQADPVVRVEASRLRARLDSYYAAHAGESRIKIELPKGGYKPVFHYKPDSGPNLAAGKARAMKKPTILVLPFVNLGPAEVLDQFARSLSEEIVIGLLRFADFNIINAAPPRSGLSRPDLPWSMADAVGARFILEGNIQYFAQMMRLRVSVVDVPTRGSLWAEKFDRRYTEQDQFAIMDELSARIIMGVGDGFGFINRFLARETRHKPVSELEIFEAILRYHNWVGTLNVDRGRNTEKALQHAMTLDPGYALPSAMLSDLYSGHYQWGYAKTPDILDKAENLAMQSLELDPDCQHGQWAWAYSLYLRKDGSQFLEVARRAVKANPYNFNILSTVGIKLCMLGHWDEGLALVRQGNYLSLGMPGWVYVAEVLRHYLDGNYPEALSTAKLITAPGFPGGHLLRAAIYGRMGLGREGEAELNELLAVNAGYRREAPELLGRIFYRDAYVEELLLGLRAAGFSPA